MIERFESNDHPRLTSIRERLLAVERQERIDMLRARRRRHRPTLALVWLAIVWFVLLVILWERR